MDVSLELTLTPLKDEYIPSIKSFIKFLRNSDFLIMENPLSTQIYGEYDAIMSFLIPQIKKTFLEETAVVLQLKLVKGDRSQYEPDF
ncbi:MAG: hypothetical protein VW080_01690 [Flavobacteriaceae bacterium]